LRAAAETGWNFSSRWLADGKTLATIRTTAAVPAPSWLRRAKSSRPSQASSTKQSFWPTLSLAPESHLPSSFSERSFNLLAALATKSLICIASILVIILFIKQM
jgi:hypothetical protein